jgi:HEAT repeat protein
MAREIREAYREPLMAALADEDPRVRESAADALQFYPSEQVTEALLATLEDEDPWVRAAIYGSLPLEKIDILFQSLPKENPIGQAAILRALAKGDANRVVPVLQTYLNHEIPEIRAAVCESLSRFPTNEIILLLLDRFNQDRTWSVRLSALRALTKIQPPKFSSILHEKISSESDPLVKKEILSALQHVQEDFFPEIIFELLIDPELADDACAYLRSHISRKDSILQQAAHCRPSLRRIVRKTLD